MLSKFLFPGIAFVLTLVFGFWVSHAGKPYNGLLFNVHKLIALGAVVVTVIQLVKVLRGADALVIVLLVVAALCVIALFASGALMSMGKLDYALMLTVHRIAPVVLAVAMVIVVLMLNGA
jgi:hypothetical protein